LIGRIGLAAAPSNPECSFTGRLAKGRNVYHPRYAKLSGKLIKPKILLRVRILLQSELGSSTDENKVYGCRTLLFNVNDGAAAISKNFADDVHIDFFGRALHRPGKSGKECGRGKTA